jgi:hypothetical protein
MTGNKKYNNWNNSNGDYCFKRMKRKGSPWSGVMRMMMCFMNPLEKYWNM